MLPPWQALQRVQELVPKLQLDLQVIGTQVIIDPVPIEEWAPVFIKALEIADVVCTLSEELPDVHPFCDIIETIEDSTALLHALYIFYECTIKDRDRESN